MIDCFLDYIHCCLVWVRRSLVYLKIIPKFSQRFLVRVRVAQQIKSILEKIQDAFFFYIFFRYVFGAQDKNGLT